jgi:uncharacterized membrane protein YkvA (DUF1232 family)
MSLKITLELSDNDLAYFREQAQEIMDKATQRSDEEVVNAARTLLDRVDETISTDYIRNRLGKLRLLIDMLNDEGWGMQSVGRGRVLTALAYFNEPKNIIPDDTPVVGYLDDAIMVELLCEELKPEIEAYQDFITYREHEATRRNMNPAELQRADFLRNREQELLSRMRRRRRRGGRGGGGGRSPLSLI